MTYQGNPEPGSPAHLRRYPFRARERDRAPLRQNTKSAFTAPPPKLEPLTV